MNKAPPNLDLVQQKLASYDGNSHDDYHDQLIQYLQDNTSQIQSIFEQYLSVFINDPSMLNFLKFIYVIVWRIGAPAFFVLEDSKLLDTDFDPRQNQDEFVEIRKILKHCIGKFKMMNALREIPRIQRKYQELGRLDDTDPDILIPPLTDFEQQYSKLSKHFQEYAEELEVIQNIRSEENLEHRNASIQKILEELDFVASEIKTDPRFTRGENDLILNFFHQKNEIWNRINDDYQDLVRSYELKKEEKKAIQSLQQSQAKRSRQIENSGGGGGGNMSSLQKDSGNSSGSQMHQSIGQMTSFTEGTCLSSFPESMTLEYKDYTYPFRSEDLKRKLKATICAFLNTLGGRILIGVSNVGLLVKGLFLDINDQDSLIRDIDALLKEFHPKVEPEEVQTVFVPVKKKDSDEFKRGFYVVKIIVKKGKPNELYFTQRDCYKRRNGKNEVQMPANFKQEIIERSMYTSQSYPDLYGEHVNQEFVDPNPETGIPVINIKGKQSVSQNNKDSQRQEDKKTSGPKNNNNNNSNSKSQNHQPQQPQQPPSRDHGQGNGNQHQGHNFPQKLQVRNLPVQIEDVEGKLRSLIDGMEIPVRPKTIKVTQQKKQASLLFNSSQDCQFFFEYVNIHPIFIESVALQFYPKASKDNKMDGEKRQNGGNNEQSDKKQKPNQLKIEEEAKKEHEKQRADRSNTIWVRGIPENTPQLKDKLSSFLGEFTKFLRDIRIHNKKKRASLEFENSENANQALEVLNQEERYIDSNKLTFEKATPPPSPIQGSKNPGDDSGNAARKDSPHNIQDCTVKITGVPLQSNCPDLDNLIQAIEQGVAKLADQSISEKYDYIYLHFLNKEDCQRVHDFIVSNNITIQGQQIHIEIVSVPFRLASKKKKKKGANFNKDPHNQESGSGGSGSPQQQVLDGTDDEKQRINSMNNSGENPVVFNLGSNAILGNNEPYPNNISQDPQESPNFKFESFVNFQSNEENARPSQGLDQQQQQQPREERPRMTKANEAPSVFGRDAQTRELQKSPRLEKHQDPANGSENSFNPETNANFVIQDPQNKIGANPLNQPPSPNSTSEQQFNFNAGNTLFNNQQQQQQYQQQQQQQQPMYPQQNNFNGYSSFGANNGIQNYQQNSAEFNKNANNQISHENGQNGVSNNNNGNGNVNSIYNNNNNNNNANMNNNPNLNNNANVNPNNVNKNQNGSGMPPGLQQQKQDIAGQAGNVSFHPQHPGMVALQQYEQQQQQQQYPNNNNQIPMNNFDPLGGNGQPRTNQYAQGQQNAGKHGGSGAHTPESQHSEQGGNKPVPTNQQQYPNTQQQYQNNQYPPQSQFQQYPPQAYMAGGNIQKTDTTAFSLSSKPQDNQNAQNISYKEAWGKTCAQNNNQYGGVGQLPSQFGNEQQKPQQQNSGQQGLPSYAQFVQEQKNLKNPNSSQNNKPSESNNTGYQAYLQSVKKAEQPQGSKGYPQQGSNGYPSAQYPIQSNFGGKGVPQKATNGYPENSQFGYPGQQKPIENEQQQQQQYYQQQQYPKNNLQQFSEQQQQQQNGGGYPSLNQSMAQQSNDPSNGGQQEQSSKFQYPWMKPQQAPGVQPNNVDKNAILKKNQQKDNKSTNSNEQQQQQQQKVPQQQPYQMNNTGYHQNQYPGGYNQQSQQIQYPNLAQNNNNYQQQQQQQQQPSSYGYPQGYQNQRPQQPTYNQYPQQQYGAQQQQPQQPQNGYNYYLQQQQQQHQQQQWGGYPQQGYAGYPQKK